MRAARHAAPRSTARMKPMSNRMKSPFLRLNFRNLLLRLSVMMFRTGSQKIFSTRRTSFWPVARLRASNSLYWLAKKSQCCLAHTILGPRAMTRS